MYYLISKYAKQSNGQDAVVITPFTALMLGSERKIIRTGFTVEFVGSAQDDSDASEVVLSQKVQLVYVIPTSVLNNKTFWECF